MKPFVIASHKLSRVVCHQGLLQVSPVILVTLFENHCCRCVRRVKPKVHHLDIISQWSKILLHFCTKMLQYRIQNVNYSELKENDNETPLYLCTIYQKNTIAKDLNCFDSLHKSPGSHCGPLGCTSRISGGTVPQFENHRKVNPKGRRLCMKTQLKHDLTSFLQHELIIVVLNAEGQTVQKEKITKRCSTEPKISNSMN